jgi:tRNA 2-selenouridine synthase
MRDAVLIEMKVDREQRVAILAPEYGSLDKDFLIECTERIRKRLGPEQTKQAIEAIRENRMEDFIRLVLVYYDKTYRNGLLKRNQVKVFSVELDSTDPVINARKILKFTAHVPAEKQDITQN